MQSYLSARSVPGRAPGARGAKGLWVTSSLRLATMIKAVDRDGSLITGRIFLGPQSPTLKTCGGPRRTRKRWNPAPSAAAANDPDNRFLAAQKNGQPNAAAATMTQTPKGS